MISMKGCPFLILLRSGVDGRLQVMHIWFVILILEDRLVSFDWVNLFLFLLPVPFSSVKEFRNDIKKMVCLLQPGPGTFLF